MALSWCDQLNNVIINLLLLIILIPRTIFIVLSIRRQPYARVHFGSSDESRSALGGLDL